MKNYTIKIISALIMIVMTIAVNAQIGGDMSFLRGKFLEIAVSDCGTYTSGANGAVQNAPLIYDNNTIDNSMSFTHDVGLDGWDVGIPDQCGDFVMPGSPEEGFAVQLGEGTVYANIQPYCYGYGAFAPDAPAFVGSNTYNINTGTTRKSAWTGTTADGAMGVFQITYFPKNAQSFLTIVDICNTSDETMTDVYYARNMDPDNDQITNGTFNTNNNAKKQYVPNNYSLVSASSTVASACLVGYVTVDPRAKASRGNFSMGEPSSMWNGTDGYVQTAGAFTGDQAIQISFKIASIPAGGCDCVAYSTYFSNSTINADIAATGTACESFGAGGRYGDADLLAAYLSDPAYFVKNEFVAYPNPSNGNFTLNLFEIENANITIKNALGQVVYASQGESKLIGVYLDHPVSGVYYLTVEHDGTSMTKPIVIE